MYEADYCLKHFKLVTIYLVQRNLSPCQPLLVIKKMTPKCFRGNQKKNKFEMFQTIISFLNLIPHVFKLAYVHYIKLKSRYIKISICCLNMISCLKGGFNPIRAEVLG